MENGTSGRWRWGGVGGRDGEMEGGREGLEVENGMGGRCRVGGGE